MSAPLRVLVVDDSAFMRAALSRVLSSDPRFVVVGQAKDGQDAVEQARKLRPDLITMDFNMPKLNGRQLCEAIRERYANQPMYIFLVTARAEQPLRTWAEGMPRVEYIEKPISLQGLLRRLEKCFAPIEGSEACDED